MSETIPNGHKFDTGKPRYELIPPSAIRLAAQIMTAGANKYDENNWTGLKTGRIIGAAFRHLNAYLSGQDTDEESTYHHVGHFLANLLMLHHIINNFPYQHDNIYSDYLESDIVEDKHIYRKSRGVTDIPQYSLLPPDSLEAAARSLSEMAKVDGDYHWLGRYTDKTLVEIILHYFLPVMEGKKTDLGDCIANTMILIDQILKDNIKDDRIFTYIKN